MPILAGGRGVLELRREDEDTTTGPEDDSLASPKLPLHPESCFSLGLYEELYALHLLHDLLEDLDLPAEPLGSPAGDDDLGQLAPVGKPDRVDRQYPDRVEQLLQEAPVRVGGPYHPDLAL